MADNRPQGRKTQVTGQSTGAYRRGSGLNTGPVGSANSNPHSTSHPTGSGHGMSRAAKTGGGGALILIILIALFLFGGNGGLSGLLGGGSDAESALGALGAYIFLQQWNNYLWPLLVTSTDNVRTVQIGVASMYDVDSEKMNLMMSAVVICLVPSLSIFIFMQKNLINGLMAGAVKG